MNNIRIYRIKKIITKNSTNVVNFQMVIETREARLEYLNLNIERTWDLVAVRDSNEKCYEVPIFDSKDFLTEDQHLQKNFKNMLLNITKDTNIDYTIIKPNKELVGVYNYNENILRYNPLDGVTEVTFGNEILPTITEKEVFYLTEYNFWYEESISWLKNRL